jgi:hypothetical protein
VVLLCRRASRWSGGWIAYNVSIPQASDVRETDDPGSSSYYRPSSSTWLMSHRFLSSASLSPSQE